MTARHALLLDVRGRRVVVVGGGPVAARRVGSLVADGADVHVVAPAICEDLAALVRDESRDAAVTWHAREYRRGDLAEAWLVHTATGDRATDAAVAAEAQATRTWCVRADDATASTAWTPAVARAGEVTVAVGAGGDPRRAVALRDAISLLLDTGSLPLRHHRPPAPADGQDGGRTVGTVGSVGTVRSVGTVTLVGGGPGDPGLITTRGRRALAEADVVVVDRLGPRALLDELDPAVEVVEAGKAPHAHTLSQDEINELLVDRARAGLRVVRLKGGDPFVLGRGGEEVCACLDAGVPVEVVPGVTSAIAVPAAAGIPVTHRGLARSVAIVSAHDDDTDWAALARFDGTLVLLMGVGRLARHAAVLVAHGLDPATPVAVVERGTLPDQRTTTGTLADIADRALARGVSNPAVVVVGAVAALAGHDTDRRAAHDGLA
ncbi:uroporphyrinogen-III C-methyltransferase [Cellulomonas soli]|uniref:Uroporphyrinogen-III C-methyltransferase n=1 Tax=Cellulomonas soli TaxID=931535 RepID=A0A512P9X0_9CELL|nr:uroporphyrinogen-III C-methyltransferase [Cellulomonas soli]NYI60492.1 uroporphyrin-III C-methyltransferase/precorrin-2 dehydrogenase/sirohydrochlorin ferrochelatase [Cellulomonas soli]GEP68007.1 uroporphyrinogen-III C-methyltransferase [Cellulomonas soli]